MFSFLYFYVTQVNYYYRDNTFPGKSMFCTLSTTEQKKQQSRQTGKKQNKRSRTVRAKLRSALYIYQQIYSIRPRGFSTVYDLRIFLLPKTAGFVLKLLTIFNNIIRCYNYNFRSHLCSNAKLGNPKPLDEHLHIIKMPFSFETSRHNPSS